MRCIVVRCLKSTGNGELRRSCVELQPVPLLRKMVNLVGGLVQGEFFGFPAADSLAVSNEWTADEVDRADDRGFISLTVHLLLPVGGREPRRCCRRY